MKISLGEQDGAILITYNFNFGKNKNNDEKQSKSQFLIAKQKYKQ